MNRTEFYRSNEKLTVSNWPPEYYIQFDQLLKIWLDETGNDITKYVNDYTDKDISAFEIYVKPKSKKQITFYEYVVESLESNKVNSSRLIWSNIPPEKVNGKHTGQTRTVEVDEDAK